jgi:hypothetical protein
MNRKKELFSEELFQKLLKEISEWPSEWPSVICPFLTNEPFLDDRIYEWCRELVRIKPSIHLVFYTNGTLFSPDRLARLEAVPNIREILCSIHHSNKDEYEAEMGIAWSQMLASISRLIAWNQKRRTRIWLLRVSNGDTEKDAKFVAFCRKEFPETSIQVSYRYNWKGDVYSQHPYQTTLDRKCPRLGHLCLLVDGRAALCCLDQNGSYSPGDFKKQTLLEIFNGEVMKKYKGSLKRGIEPCCQCNMIG